MNVAGAALDCVCQDDVHQLHDGRFVGHFLELVEAHFFFFRLQLHIGVHLVHRRHHSFQIVFAGRGVGFLDALHDGGFRRHYRLNVEAGHKLDIVHGEDVGWIDHGDGQRRAYPAEWQNLISLGGLMRDQLHYRGVNLEEGKIDGGHAILAGKKISDVLVGKKAELHQRGAQPRA